MVPFAALAVFTVPGHFCFSLQAGSIGSLSIHEVDGSGNAIRKRNFAFLQPFFNCSKSLCLNILELNWNQLLGHNKTTFVIYAHVVHTTAKPLISRSRKNENVFKMSKDEKCTCKACKTIVFYCRIWKFVGFLLLSLSWLLKLPIPRLWKARTHNSLGAESDWKLCKPPQNLKNMSRMYRRLRYLFRSIFTCWRSENYNKIYLGEEKEGILFSAI